MTDFAKLHDEFDSLSFEEKYHRLHCVLQSYSIDRNGNTYAWMVDALNNFEEVEANVIDYIFYQNREKDLRDKELQN